MTQPAPSVVYRIPATYRLAMRAFTGVGLLATVGLVVALAASGHGAVAAVASPLVLMSALGLALAVRLPSELSTDAHGLAVTAGRTRRTHRTADVQRLGREPLSGLVYLRLDGARSVWIPTSAGWPELAAALDLPIERCAPAAMRCSVWRDGLALGHARS
jgi:hypothetical protein